MSSRLLSSLVLSRLLGVAVAVAPAYAIDMGLGRPQGGLIVLRDGVDEDPQDRLVLWDGTVRQRSSANHSNIVNILLRQAQHGCSETL